MKKEKTSKKLSFVKKSGFKTGYNSKNYSNNTNPYQTKKIYDYNNVSNRFPTGITPFVCLMVLFLIGIIITITLGLTLKISSQQNYVPQQWQNILWYVSGIVECLVGLWILGRAGFLSHARFALMKLGRTIKISKLRTKIKAKLGQDLAIDEVVTIQEWEEFLELRKRYTKKWWNISWITFTSIFGFTTVLMLIISGINSSFVI